MMSVFKDDKERMIVDKEALQRALDEYSNPETLEQGKALGERYLQLFVDDELDVSEDSLDVFAKIIETFGTVLDNDGTPKLTKLGAQAAAKYEGIVASLENAENALDKERIYSLTSDQNQVKFDIVTLKIYQEMGLVDDDIDVANLTPQQVAEKINSVFLNVKQRTEYAGRFIDVIVNDSELFEITPPKILTDAYIFSKEQMRSNPKDKKQAERFKTLAMRIDYLIKHFAEKSDYFYSDPSNIADVYAGYRKMCDVRNKDLRNLKSDNDATKEYKADVRKSIEDTQKRLEEIVSLYSDIWNLKDITPSDASKLDARWSEISEKLKDVELTDDILATLAKYEFLDNDGKPMPQFVDEDGVLHNDFQPGYKLNPDGRLNRIISLAKNDITMRNVGKLDVDVNDLDLTAMLFDRVPWKMAEISVPDQVISGIESKPQVMLSQQDVDEFWAEIETNGGQITDSGYQAALDAQVNQVAGFAGMVADRVGADKPIVMRPFDAVADIDKLAKSRTEQAGAAERKQKIGFFKRGIKNFGAAAVMSAGLTFIGKATGVAYAGAAVGTAIGIGNMIVQGFKWRKEQKKQGRPHGLKAFFSDKRNWGPAVSSGLGVAAVISMATGNPELAAGFGIGAMGVGGVSAAKAAYDDAINAGYTKGQALAGAIAVVGMTFAGGLAGRAAMNGVINYVNNNTDSNLFKTEQTTTTTREAGTTRVYNDGVIEQHKEMMLKNHWETPQSLDTRINGLMDSGLSYEDSMRYLLAWHDATDHNLGPGYFNSIGMTAESLSALRGSISGTVVNLTPESIAAFEHFNPHISATNTVGYFAGAPVSYDLPGNAAYDSNGVLIPGKEVFSTYVNNGGSVFNDVPIISTETNSIFTPNELANPAGIGALGIYEPRVLPAQYLSRLRDRAGALADRSNKIIPASNDGKTDKEKPNGENNPPTDTHSGDENPPTGGPSDAKSKKNKRGFFGTCKDTTYKIMQSVYNGLLKIQKGVHNMRLKKIQNQNERAIERAKGIKDLADAYDGMSIDEINEVTLKDAAAIAAQNEKLKKRLGEKRLKLYAKFESANLEKKFEYKARIDFIDSLTEALNAFDADTEGLDAKERLKVLKELEKSADDILMGRTKRNILRRLEEIQGKGGYLRKWAQNCIQLFKGLGDTTPEDIKNAENDNELKKVKSKGAIFETGMMNITAIMNDSGLSAEEKLAKIEAIHQQMEAATR